jgi:tyrosinase
MDLNTRIHYTGYFLPWHRWYINFFGKTLKEKCGYTGVTPYWNWSIDASNFQESSFWDSDPVSGVGGWGDPENDYQIADGGLANFTISYPVHHNIRRNYTYLVWANLPIPLITDHQAKGNLSFTTDVVESILQTGAGDYEEIQVLLEAIQGPHGAVHGIVAADLGGYCPTSAGPNCVPGPRWSSNDPLFFFHHAMLDKIWYDWQNLDPLNAQSYFGGSVESIDTLAAYDLNPTGVGPYLDLSSVIPVDGLDGVYTVGDMLSTTSGALCYKYE